MYSVISFIKRGKLEFPQPKIFINSCLDEQRSSFLIQRSDSLDNFQLNGELSRMLKFPSWQGRLISKSNHNPYLSVIFIFTFFSDPTHSFLIFCVSSIFAFTIFPAILACLYITIDCIISI